MVESVAYHSLADQPADSALAELVRGRLHLTHGIADDSWASWAWWTRQMVNAAVDAGFVSDNNRSRGDHDFGVGLVLTSEGRALAIARGWWPDVGNVPEEGPETPQEPSAGEGPGPNAPETSDALEDDRAPLGVKHEARLALELLRSTTSGTRHAEALRALAELVLALPDDD